MTSAFISNPILAFELRARRRMGRSFLLVLCVAVVLSLLAGFVYQSAVVRASSKTFNAFTGTYIPPSQNLSARMSQVGRDLFVPLVCSNALLWLFLSAALAASGIATERERGLLESLQLSQMTPRSQIAARFAANGLMLLVLQLTTLPIYAVAFWMGGISPSEVGLGLYSVAWAAMLGTAFGLCFSARSYRPTGAVFGVLGALSFYSLLIYWYVQGMFRFGFSDAVSEILIFLHPVAFLYRYLNGSSLFVFHLSTKDLLLWENSFWFLVCGALLWNTAWWVSRTLPPPIWQSRAPWLEGWTRGFQTRRQTEQTKRKASERLEGALLADLPLDKFVHFRDPLLSREVKSRFRLRRVGFWIGLVRFAIFVIAASCWVFGAFWLTDAQARPGLAPYGLRVMLYSGVLCLSVLAATSFTRERESGTWEGLKLSLLTPREILRAKWSSPLVSFLYYGAPLWVLLPIGACYIDFGLFLLAALIVFSWLSLAVALGLWVSWRAPHSTAAMAWSTGVLLVLLVVLPWLNGLVGIDRALVNWKYGVSISPYSTYLVRDVHGNYPAYIVARYKADTGRSVISQPVSSTYRFFYDMGLESWLSRQQSQAEQFAAFLWSWHPGKVLDSLFYETDRKFSPSPGRNSRPFTPINIVMSLVLPLGLSLVLMAWLRRDVHREQLNT